MLEIEVNKDVDSSSRTIIAGIEHKGRRNELRDVHPIFLRSTRTYTTVGL